MNWQEHRQAAHAALFDGLARGDELWELQRAVAQHNVRGTFCPDIAMLEIVAAALDAADVNPISPVSTVGWQDHLEDARLTGRDRSHVTFMLHAAAAFRTGLRPDLLEITRWQTPLWQPAFLAAVMTVRATAGDRAVSDVCREVALRIPDFHGDGS